MHPNIITHLNIIHSLRRDQDKLLANRASSRLDHHGHTRAAVDRVHEDVEFIQTADRASDGFPNTQQKTNG
jgi:hypothetical protein